MIENIKNDILDIYNSNKNIKNKTIKHNTIQKQVEQLSSKYSYIGKHEYRCKYLGYKNKEDINGKIDVIWKDENNNIILAFEVDSSARPKSIIKLININSKYKIWLYYGKKGNKINKYIKELDTSKCIEKLFVNM